MNQSLLMILIHVIDYALLSFAKWILDQHRIRLDPINLSEPANEARSSQADSIKRKIMRLEIRFRRREITKIAIARVGIGWIDRLGVSDPGQAARSLWVIRVRIEHRQRHLVVLFDIASMLGDGADENYRLAVMIERVRSYRAERIPWNIDRMCGKDSEALMIEQPPCGVRVV